MAPGFCGCRCTHALQRLAGTPGCAGPGQQLQTRFRASQAAMLPVLASPCKFARQRPRPPARLCCRPSTPQCVCARAPLHLTAVAEHSGIAAGSTHQLHSTGAFPTGSFPRGSPARVSSARRQRKASGAWEGRGEVRRTRLRARPGRLRRDGQAPAGPSGGSAQKSGAAGCPQKQSARRGLQLQSPVAGDMPQPLRG